MLKEHSTSGDFLAETPNDCNALLFNPAQEGSSRTAIVLRVVLQA